ncbi:MAG: hypothetical protein FWG83_04240 [Oscillospiraceae bacterium]|nr:hypothetical protein [Oscillospiraceae bacterium]
MEDKRFNNFDDFDNANKPQTFDPSKIDRDDCGKLPTDLAKAGQRFEIPIVEDTSFGGLFPQKSIDCTTMKNLFFDGEDNYDKVMAVCMLLTVVSILNPATLMAGALNGQMLQLVFMFGVVIFFSISVLVGKKSFWLPGLGVIGFLKIFCSMYALVDVITAVMLMSSIYFIYKSKHSH